MDELLEELRKIAEPDDTDSTLLSFLSQARYVILNRMYPYLDEGAFADLTVPDRFIGKQIQIAAYLLNKRGAEGETQHIENGIHRNYKSAFVPEDMLWDILPQIGIPR